MKDKQVHMSHCFQGEWEDWCKYGDDDDCPANPKKKVGPECSGNSEKFSGNYHCSRCGKSFRIWEQAEFIAHQKVCDYNCPTCHGKPDRDKLIKDALKKDFRKLYVKEFTTDWEIQRLIRETEIDVMSFDNLLALLPDELKDKK